jgi:hypothetical protein
LDRAVGSLLLIFFFLEWGGGELGSGLGTCVVIWDIRGKEAWCRVDKKRKEKQIKRIIVIVQMYGSNPNWSLFGELFFQLLNRSIWVPSP